MSITQRITHVVVDQLGMDPLRDKSFDAIKTITSYRLFTVTESEKFNAPLIAFQMYDREDLWWAILVYNGIPDAFTLKPGLRIRIPDLNQLLSVLASANSEKKKALKEL